MPVARLAAAPAATDPKICIIVGWRSRAVLGVLETLRVESRRTLRLR